MDQHKDLIKALKETKPVVVETKCHDCIDFQKGVNFSNLAKVFDSEDNRFTGLNIQVSRLL